MPFLLLLNVLVFSWTHLLDRQHFALQILTAWHGNPDSKKFQSDVYDILETPSVNNLSSLLKQHWPSIMLRRKAQVPWLPPKLITNNKNQGRLFFARELKLGPAHQMAGKSKRDLLHMILTKRILYNPAQIVYNQWF